MIGVTRRLGGPQVGLPRVKRTALPDVSREQGLEWVVECIEAVLPAAREQDVVLGLENHYKDGFWKYPEFAQKQDVFLELLNAIPEREYFGVQYDPSNAIVAEDDPSSCCGSSQIGL
jgi:sugar phosphate isomerase/epimerase